MSFSAGDKLGPYEILSPLGAGGMGEVYKARDPRLDRTVAIKTSKVQFSERFEREAQAVAALNHPNICILHDVGPNYLVMELVEGQPLKGPLPLDKVLSYASQICDALSAAHEKGITHRDLKPANILVSKQGIKLLDFGLAKRVEARPVSEETVTSALTGEGVVLGTPQYMAPEQIEGREADARSDIFALGCVLYEMVTGKKAFEGKTASSIAAAILAREPEAISKVQPLTPASLERVIQACLAKDPDDRWQSARDVKIGLKGVGAVADVGVVQKPSRVWQVAAAVGAVAAVLAGVGLYLKGEAAAGEVGRFEMSENVFEANGRNYALISPDGRTLAFLSNRADGRRQIYLRRLDSVTPIAVGGTEGVNNYFWSPDSKSIGFAIDTTMQKVDLSSGSVTTIFEGGAKSAIWVNKDTIVFEPSTPGPLMKVSVNGGAAEGVSVLGEQPRELQHDRLATCGEDGRFLYGAKLEDGKEVWRVGSITGKKPVTIQSSGPMLACSMVGSGPAKGEYLISYAGTAIQARRFDLDTGELIGPAVKLAESKYKNLSNSLSNHYSVSNNGVLVYRSQQGTESGLAWFDRNGKLVEELPREIVGLNPAISPDGKMVAMGRGMEGWVSDLSRGTSMRLTNGEQQCTLPTWSVDSKRIACAPGGQIVELEVNGSGATRNIAKVPSAWLQHYSPDGQRILYVDPLRKSLMSIGVDGKEAPVEIAPSGPSYFPATYSPDGRFISYASGESGRLEVYVRAVAPGAGKWLVSTQGGGMPTWRGDGRELFYLSPELDMMAVDVELSPTFRPSTPRVLFRAKVSGNNNRRNNFVVSRDGQKFLISTQRGEASPISIVLNWPALFHAPHAP